MTEGTDLRQLALALLALVFLAFPPALAQEQVSPSAGAKLDALKAAIDGVEARLGRGDLSDATLVTLRNEIDPVAAQATGIATQLAPRVEAVKARLTQLGPAPDPKAPPEPTEVSKERAAQQKLFDDLDATAKRAKVLAVQASQISDGLVARRRALFTHALLARSASLFSPALWSGVAADLPSDYRALSTLTVDFTEASWNKLSVLQRGGLGGLLALLALLYWPSWLVACRIRSRGETADPSRLRKALAAIRVAVATASVPIVAVLALGGIVELFGLPTQFQQIGHALTIGVAVVAVMTGISRGLLAPKSPNWRLVPLSDIGAKALYHVTISVSVVVAVQKLVEAINELIGVAVPTAVATRGLGAFAVAIVLLLETRKAHRAAAVVKDMARTPQMNHWTTILRLIAWSIIAALIGAAVVGYVAFASFLVEQVIAVAGTLALLYILLTLADEGISFALRPKGSLGRMLIVGTGLRAATLDQIGILFAGLAKIVLYVATVLLVLAPWQFESGDMLATLNAAFFGFSVGDVTISISTIVVSLLLFAFCIAATRTLQRWLEVKYLPHTKLDAGLRNSIKTSLGYVGAVLALAIALAHMGVGLEKLTIVAGGLSVGIGLGLQTITNNFVSGLILLWERAVRVGDRITVGGEQGYVRRINVRSTEIETFDRALVVMPNASLVTGTVKNWVRNDRIGRIDLPFVLPVTTDPEDIRAMLVKTAKAHDLVLAIPTPQLFFTAMTETHIHLELICYVEDVDGAMRVTSDLLFEIYAGFKQMGLIAAPAPPTVTSPALDKLDAWLSARATDTAPGDARKGRSAAAE